jgi:hypothetical protein
LRALPTVPFINSSIDAPDIYERYAGTSGKTHGEKNDIKPRKNAAGIETDAAIDNINSFCNVFANMGGMEYGSDGVLHRNPSTPILHYSTPPSLYERLAPRLT